MVVMELAAEWRTITYLYIICYISKFYGFPAYPYIAGQGLYRQIVLSLVYSIRLAG